MGSKKPAVTAASLAHVADDKIADSHPVNEPIKLTLDLVAGLAMPVVKYPKIADFTSLKGIFKEIVPSAVQAFPANAKMTQAKLAQFFADRGLGDWSASNLSVGNSPKDATPANVGQIVLFAAGYHPHYKADAQALALRAMEIASVIGESGGRRQEAKSAIRGRIAAILGSTETLDESIRNDFTVRLLDLCAEFGGAFDALAVNLPDGYEAPEVADLVPADWTAPEPKPRKKKEAMTDVINDEPRLFDDQRDSDDDDDDDDSN